MSKCTVITEGETDRLVLQAVLARTTGLDDVSLIAAKGWSSADSLARSILIRGIDNVALVIDADSTDPSRIDERRRFLEESLGSVRSRNQWRVFLMEPELEVVFFRDRQFLESFLGRSVSDEQFVRGQFEPKSTLEMLSSAGNLNALAERLATLDLSAIVHDKAISRLVDFVRRSLHPTRTSSRSRPLKASR